AACLTGLLPAAAAAHQGSTWFEGAAGEPDEPSAASADSADTADTAVVRDLLATLPMILVQGGEGGLESGVGDLPAARRLGWGRARVPLGRRVGRRARPPGRRGQELGRRPHEWLNSVGVGHSEREQVRSVARLPLWGDVMDLTRGAAERVPEALRAGGYAL